jgi:arsenate reductase
MAEGWARVLKDDVIEPFSAGVETHGLNSRAVQVMAGAGVAISHNRSKLVDDLEGVTFDYVITVCDNARETCPILPGQTKTVHQSFDDPPFLAKSAGTEEESLSHYRKVRDEIREFVSTLPDALQNSEA